MALTEPEVVSFAESLDDHELVSITDIGCTDPDRFWVVVREHRFGLEYEIASYGDYQDFVTALVEHRRCPLQPFEEWA